MNEQLRGAMGQRWVQRTSVYPLEVLYEARVVSLPGTQETSDGGGPAGLRAQQETEWKWGTVPVLELQAG